MNDNNELDALLATIEGELWEQCPDCLGSGFSSGNSKGEPCPTCDGGEIVENIKGREALATLRTKLAALEAEREALRDNNDHLMNTLLPFANEYESFIDVCERGYTLSFAKYFYDKHTPKVSQMFVNAFALHSLLSKQS